MRNKGTLLQEKNFKFTLIHIPRFGNHRRQSGNLKHVEKPDIRYTFVKNILGAALGFVLRKNYNCIFFYNNMSNTDRSFQENRTSDSF